jgi:hypothetical protein
LATPPDVCVTSSVWAVNGSVRRLPDTHLFCHSPQRLFIRSPVVRGKTTGSSFRTRRRRVSDAPQKVSVWRLFCFHGVCGWWVSGFSITDSGVGATGEPTTSLETQGDALAFVVLAFPAGWRTVRAEMPSSLDRARRGTGVAHGEGKFSPEGPRNHGAGPVALSSFVHGISVRIQRVPAIHRTGFNTAGRMRLF